MRSQDSGTFEISGSGFLPNKPVFISVGISGTAGTLKVLTESVDASGNLTSLPADNLCIAPGITLAFAANDGRIVNGHDLFSNTVEVSCPG